MKLSVVFRVCLVAALGWCYRGVALGNQFSNPAPILIPAAGSNGGTTGVPAGLYPSTITVSGMPTSIVSMSVFINDFRHRFPDDVDILLVSPSGRKMVIWSDVGGNSANSTCGGTCDNGSNPGTTGVSIKLDDGAGAVLPDSTALASGIFRPTNIAAGDLFPAPAPAGPYQDAAPAGSATLTSTFFGDNPNGVWALYVVDDNTGDSGRIQGGWSIDIFANFSNPNPILIPAPGHTGDVNGDPASPYPSTIVVSGMPTKTTSVSVLLSDFRHHFPDDVDMLLVSPTGKKMIIMSDVGGNTTTCGATCDNGANLGTTGPNLFLSAGSGSMPDSGPLSQNYLPTDYGTGDVFPAPAPAGAYNDPAPAGAATVGIFFGDDPNGTWSLYVVDDTSGDSGRMLGGWSLYVSADAPPTAAGQLIISEFRLRGPAGVKDEFIELYNPLDVPLVTHASDASNSLAVAASDGVIRCEIFNGTTIPAHGHLLCVNSAGYSLNAYPAGSGAFANGDLTYTTEIPDNKGLAIFNTSNAANFSMATRLDAVGPTNDANSLYKEGQGYPTLNPLSLEYSVFRKYDPVSGRPTDTGNNATDFMFLDTTGTSTGFGQHLGSPGPENLSSPVFGSGIAVSAVDPGCNGIGSATSACGTVRDTTPGPASTSSDGTLSIRRKFTNNTGVPLTRLRFRVTNLTTFLHPGASDLRVITSSTFTGSLSGGGSTQINGLILESPPTVPFGNGFNASLSADGVTLGTPLAAGASIDVSFLLGLKQTGAYQFDVQVEALPLGGAMLSVSGNTEDCAMQTCPANITKITAPNQCGAIVNYAAPVLAGSCPASNCTPASGSFFPKGATTVTCTSPTAPTCTFTVTVNDSQSPSITCPANIFQQAASGQNSAVVNYNSPKVSDNCPGVGAPVCTPVSGSAFGLGTTAVNCSVTDAANLTTSCSFNVTVAPAGTSPTPNPTATATATSTPTPTPATTTQTLNIATRMQVQTGGNVLIAGFIITGNAQKTVGARGIGPSLAQFFSGALADPTLELHSGASTLTANDNWQDDPTQAMQLSTHGLSLTDPKESGIFASLQPGPYTAILAGKNGGTGIGLVELYDLDQAADSQLANISTRGLVLTGNDVMIGGFILGGPSGSSRIAIRGVGPTLAQFGLSPVLADPTLELHDGNGAVIGTNDNWQDDSAQAAQLAAAGLALADPKEAGMAVLLPPGTFTAILAGKNGGTGIGVIEVYNIH